MMKCSISWICLIVLCLCAFPMSRQVSATSHSMGNITWEVEDGRATISGTGTLADYACPWGVKKEEITQVVIMPGVQGIGKGVFKGFSALTTVTIHEGLKHIDDYAFQDCVNLESITIPSSLKSIATNAFMGCTALKSVYIDDLLSWCGVNFKDHGSNPLSSGADLYVGGQLVTDLVIPEGLDTIAPLAFTGCASIRSVTLPKGMTEIQAFTFSNCVNLKYVTLAGSVNFIGNGAFHGCSSLTRITFQGTQRQLKKLNIHALNNSILLNTPVQLGFLGQLLYSTWTQSLDVVIQVGILFLILHIRRRRRGY